MKLLRLHTVRLMLTALMVLSATTSCYNYSGDDDLDLMDVGTAANYINITISVRAGQYLATRGLPNGGEDGDGREKGIDTRENEVEGVTLIFYQDAANTTAGVNASADNAATTTIDYAVYYGVTRDDSHAFTHPTGHTDEVFYTTGDKKLTAPLSSDNKYRLLVVANANLTGSITAGTTTLAQVRDMVLSSVYTGSGKGTDASKFVMTSADDTELTFNSYTDDKERNRRIFNFDNIHIERLAARIDYWAKYSNGYKTSTDNTAYTTAGYEYTVKKPNGTDSEDRFVLTRITPFNLNNGDEYIVKRTNDGTNPYLHDETTANWVVDPNTSRKNSTDNYASYASRLADVVTTFQNEYTVAMSAEQSNRLTIDTHDNIVLGYAKENTLSSSGVSPLYYHATGLAFEGYYYNKGKGTGTRYVFYYFIRHQGEQDAAYQAFNNDNINTDATKALVCPSSPAMNFGIVRNNIYRISIEKITSMGGTIKIAVKEMHWRHVDNPVIYL